MSILAECPICHTKQSAKNKLCRCGENLDKLKRSKRVRYWISFRKPDGKQKREPIGFSIEEARVSDAKRKVQKKENRILEILTESKMTFQELTDWYIELKKVKNLKSYKRVKVALGQVNAVFGAQRVNTVKPEQLENYQERRLEEGKAPATVDMELTIVKTMVANGEDNEKVGAQAFKAFRNIKRNHGGWISPIEKGYGALMTTDLWPEQEPEKAKEAIELLLATLPGKLAGKDAGATVCVLGPVYDMLGPQYFNIHLLVKAMKREFDPKNISNPPYATTPDVIDPAQLGEMTKVL
jgi:hypothetical protein